MFWAENAVLEGGAEKLRKLRAQTGGTWLKVSPLLEQCAEAKVRQRRRLAIALGLQVRFGGQRVLG